MRFSNSIFLVASLGFPGLGVQPPSPDWDCRSTKPGATSRSHHGPCCSAGAIVLLIVATNLMTDGMDVMRPAWTRSRTMEDVVLEVNGIDVEYRTEAGTLNAVRDVSFRIHRREARAWSVSLALASRRSPWEPSAIWRATDGSPVATSSSTASTFPSCRMNSFGSLGQGHRGRLPESFERLEPLSSNRQAALREGATPPELEQA